MVCCSALPIRLKMSVVPAAARPWRAEGMAKRSMRYVEYDTFLLGCGEG